MRHRLAIHLFAALLVAALAATRAAAWEYPLLPHVPAMAFWPVQPDDRHATIVELSAVYPVTEAWVLTDPRVVDSAHVELTLRAGTPGDSVSSWVHDFDLGILAAGPHEVTITATVLPGVGNPLTEHITVPFDVVHGALPPPPPPPSDSTNTLLTQALFEPAAPVLGDALTLHLYGRAPFACIAATPTIYGSAIEVRLAPGTCADTARTWTADLALGTPGAGPQAFPVTIVIDGDPARTEQYTFTVQVYDPNNPPPPPPPPIDSVNAGLSSSRPNPFSEESRFSVSLETARPAEVAVFDVSGRRVRTVFRGTLPQGTSELAWDGRRDDGRRTAGGLYFYRLTLPDRVVTRRVVLLQAP